MLQGGDDLGVPLEPSDEVWVGRDRFVEHLHRDVSPDTGLDPPEHDAVRTRSDLLQEPVSAERLPAQIQPRVLFQDPLVEPRELR